MLIPEVILYHTVNSIFALVKKDYEDNMAKTTPTPELSILYDLFKKDDNGYDLKMNRFDYYEQAKKLFVDSQQPIS